MGGLLTKTKDSIEPIVPSVPWRISMILLLLLGLFYMICCFVFLGMYDNDACKVNDVQHTTIQNVLTGILVVSGIMFFASVIVYWQKVEHDSGFFTVMKKGGWFVMSTVLMVCCILLNQTITKSYCDDTVSKACASGLKTGSCMHDDQCVAQKKERLNIVDCNNSSDPGLICCVGADPIKTPGSLHDNLIQLSGIMMYVSIGMFGISCVSTLWFYSESTEEKFEKLKENYVHMGEKTLPELEEMYRAHEHLEEEAFRVGDLPDKNKLEETIKDKYAEKYAEIIFSNLKREYKKYDETVVPAEVEKAYTEICQFNEENYPQTFDLPHHPITPEKIIGKIMVMNKKDKEIDEADLTFIKDTLCKAKGDNDVKRAIQELSVQKIADIIKFNRNKRSQEVLKNYCAPAGNIEGDDFGIKKKIRDEGNVTVVSPIHAKCKDYLSKQQLSAAIDLKKAKANEQRIAQIDLTQSPQVKQEVKPEVKQEEEKYGELANNIGNVPIDTSNRPFRQPVSNQNQNQNEVELANLGRPPPLENVVDDSIVSLLPSNLPPVPLGLPLGPPAVPPPRFSHRKKSSLAKLIRRIKRRNY